MKYFLSFLGLIFMHSIGQSQDVEVNSFVDKNNVGVNEVINFSISTNSNCQIYTPDFNGLRVIQGPFRSSSSQIVNINGQRSVEQELKFTYRLSAPKKGNYTIKAVSMVCAGKTYKTKPITIKVANGNASNSTQNSTVPAKNADFFMKMYSSKSEVYEGEPFVLSLKIFSKSQPQNIENLEIGDSKGLWRKDLNPNKTTFDSKVENINGVRYYTTTIRSELCIAQNSGKIVIEPAHISALFRRGFFQQFRRECNSNRISVKVKSLPKNAPKNFNGLVGSFKLNHNISRSTLKPGEAIDLEVKISGTGNLNTFDDPDFSFPNDFEQFDPEIKNNLSYKRDGISGSIGYNYVLIPTFYGNYTIPSYNFSYFDLETESYKSLSTGDFNVEVLKTANSEPGSTTLVQTKKSVEIEDEDIHHLLNHDSALFGTDSFLVSKFWYYGLLLLPFITIWLLLLKRKKTQSESYLNNQETLAIIKQSESQLKQARELANQKKNKAACQEISVALKTFLKHQNKISNLEMNWPYLNQLYLEKGWSTDKIEALKQVWNNLEMYQYAPITAERLDELITDTESLIEHIAEEK
ncbi:MAG: BatD family protein [Crocinitomicaceae bacterium]